MTSVVADGPSDIIATGIRVTAGNGAQKVERGDDVVPQRREQTDCKS